MKKRAAKKVGRKERGITGERSKELLRNTKQKKQKVCDNFGRFASKNVFFHPFSLP